MNPLKRYNLIRRNGNILYVSVTDSRIGILEGAKVPQEFANWDIEYMPKKITHLSAIDVSDNAQTTNVAYDYIIHKNAGCTAPANGHSARHCFSEPLDNAEGQPYDVYVGDNKVATGTVTKDYFKPKWWYKLLSFFRIPFLYTDLVEVNTYNKYDAKLIGVLSAGNSSSIAFFEPVEILAFNQYPLDVIGYSYIFPEKKRVEWKGTVERLAFVRVTTECCDVIELNYYVRGNINFIPGTSGSPALA